jgi:Abnormal spindle-like microcephaly-assoc'd, ASPM-SPD-2-Hydin
MMKLLPPRWNALLVLLALGTMLGCQGLSSSNKASTSPPSNPTTKQGQLTVIPASVSFSAVMVGNNQSQPATLTNSGGSTLQVTQVTATGTGFSVSGLSFPVTLASGQSQGFTVIFTPKSPGVVTGHLAIANTGSTPTVNVALSGASQTAGILSPSPSSLNFGSVQVGSNQVLPETLTNTGGSTVTITLVNPTGAGFTVSGLNLPLVLTAGQGQSFNVTFTPATTGSSSGNLAIISDASNSPVNVALSGTGLAPGALTPNPSSLSFGNVQVGNNQQLNETITNTGGVNVSVSQATISGTGFSMTAWAPLVLTPGQHYTFPVTFTPASSANYSGNVSIVSNATNPNLSIPLSGTGTPVPQGQLTVSPSSMNFGNVAVGTNAQLQGTLTASGESVTVTSDTLNGSAFALSGLSSYPIVIPAGQHVTFTVTFTPPGTGVASGTLSFYSNASNSPAVESLTGTGTPPPQHSVNLSWTASTSQNITGYNIYRGVKSGGPYSKINSVLNASTLYTDTTVTDGVTYYYVTTAVNSNNSESAYSNQATAVIPPP